MPVTKIFIFKLPQKHERKKKQTMATEQIKFKKPTLLLDISMGDMETPKPHESGRSDLRNRNILLGYFQGKTTTN